MSTTLLHLDSSILGDQSVSRQLSASVVARLTEGDPAIVGTYRDLAANALAHLSGAHLAARQPGVTPSETLRDDVALGDQDLAAFLAADIVVLGVAFYNFGVPSQLKAWVDRLAVAGKTFRYTEKGPEGLAGGKRVILAIARGGHYGSGSPAAPFEHAETYLRGVFAFFGVTDIEVVSADGLAAGPEARVAGIAVAERRIAALPA